MTRTLLAAAAVGLFTLGTASAQYPAPYPVPVPVPVGHHHHHYHVTFRTCSHEPWRTYATFESHAQAHRVAHHLEHRGFEARVVHH